jgi:hypothetical protein
MGSTGEWSVWICSNCRRRVPGQFQECRCGALRAHALGVIAPEEESAGPSIWPKIAMGLGFGAALAGAWLWFVRSPEVIPKVEQAAVAQPPATMSFPVENANPPVQPQIDPQAPPTPLPQARVEMGGQAPGAEFRFDPGRPAPAEPPSTVPPTTLSEIERAKQAGRQQLAQEFSALAGNARRLIRLVGIYEGARCHGRPDDDCAAVLAEINRVAVQVGAGMDRTEEIARKSWLDPGVVREMRAQYGLDDSIWDEIERETREYRR